MTLQVAVETSIAADTFFNSNNAEATMKERVTFTSEGETSHLAYYDDEEILERSVTSISDWVAKIESEN